MRELRWSVAYTYSTRTYAKRIPTPLPGHVFLYSKSVYDHTGTMEAHELTTKQLVDFMSINNLEMYRLFKSAILDDTRLMKWGISLEQVTDSIGVHLDFDLKPGVEGYIGPSAYPFIYNIDLYTNQLCGPLMLPLKAVRALRNLTTSKMLDINGRHLPASELSVKMSSIADLQ